MGFSEETLEHVALNGFRKSKTILSLHMSGNFEDVQLLNRFREWMKVVKQMRKVSRDDEGPPMIGHTTQM